MKRTSVIFSPVFYKHKPGKGHPESAERLRSIIRELRNLEEQGIGDWQFVKPKKARLEDVELVHGLEYIEFIDEICKIGGGVLDFDENTVASAESFQVALNAAGGTIKAANLIMKGEFQNSFALVRPPGHHAGEYSAGGFCIFNNIAITARYLLNNFSLRRILILDIDAHHGNGTQEIFYSTDEVLYISLHEDPKGFPGTGFVYEIGKERGLGYNVNIPLPFGTGDPIYLKAFNEIVKPIVQQYKPQFILVSAGLDGHYTDPVANLSLSTLCYQDVCKEIANLASRICRGRLLFVLEGGYSLDFLGVIASAIIAVLGQTPYVVNDRPPAILKNVIKQGKKVINQVKQVQKKFWDT
ncbi:MAG: histone deacetylase [Candidatus Bathyarchaeota archaeon]|jgi:acetoin utilization deacetylase AcuC-like enzyme